MTSLIDKKKAHLQQFSVISKLEKFENSRNKIASKKLRSNREVPRLRHNCTHNGLVLLYGAKPRLTAGKICIVIVHRLEL
jgi:hypothetical protein